MREGRREKEVEKEREGRKEREGERGIAKGLETIQSELEPKQNRVKAETSEVLILIPGYH